ncbi:hypothetical protein ACFPJ1_42200 [Kribbella qitaiheensis]|uniref:hypothetical protein n=1 Tax=Kribbella qitaiheensis TaxID=1544730 RepID=UPI00360EB073
MVITGASFPTPDFIKVSPNPDVWDQQARFAEIQADGANRALARLDVLLDDVSTVEGRAQAFQQVYRELAAWRAELAQQPAGQRPGASPEDYQMAIGHSYARDAFGLGTHRSGSKLDEGRRVLAGGMQTPASRLSERLGEIAETRFEAEGPSDEVLQNRVRLPDGSSVAGNVVCRGEAAARQYSVPFAIQGFYCTLTGREEDRRRLQGAAFQTLAKLEGLRAEGRDALVEDPAALKAFRDAEYFIYQGPEYRRGGDATIRTLLAASHTRVFQVAPKLPQDIDVMAYVAGQDGFDQHVASKQQLLSGAAPSESRSAGHGAAAGVIASSSARPKVGPAAGRVGSQSDSRLR